MLAIISDIHANTEALTAVLEDIASRQIKRIICLGDVLGYGPNPRECLDLIMAKTAITLMGNHDFAVLYEPARFNIGAEVACFWTRRQLDTEDDDAKYSARWDFLGTLPVKYNMPGEDVGMGDLVFVHGSPRRPVSEYIFPDDVYNSPNKVTGLFDRFNHLCFVGHTHVPGVFLETPDFYSPDELEGTFEVTSRKALINVGSVGQPRDRDSRASYVVIEPGVVRFLRIPYDVDATMQKVYAVDELDDYLGTRLKEGR
ncbi:MAG: metallophosphoesterase [Phycisphaerae bacterium]|nr:metallophosphoesterase [Phycisphaerae bacterium]